MPRYEISEGTSHKFWDIQRDGTSFTTTYGRIGTAGQSSTKSFADETKAQKEYDKLVREKTDKGYVLVSADLGVSSLSSDSSGAEKSKDVGAQKKKKADQFAVEPSDKEKLLQMMKMLSKEGLVGFGSKGQTQSIGHEIAAEIMSKEGLNPQLTSYVFWHKQSDRAFDAKGVLVADLMLHWSGDRQKIAEALTAHCADFDLTVARSEHEAFVVRPKFELLADLDPTDSAQALRVLASLLSAPAKDRTSPEVRKCLVDLVRHGEIDVALQAYAYLHNGGEGIDEEGYQESLVRRIDESPKFQARAAQYDYVVGMLLVDLKAQRPKIYAEVVERWQKSKNSLVRQQLGVHLASHLKDVGRLWLLLNDRSPLVRSVALHSLIDQGDLGAAAVDKELTRDYPYRGELSDKLQSCKERFDDSHAWQNVAEKARLLTT